MAPSAAYVAVVEQGGVTVLTATHNLVIDR